MKYSCFLFGIYNVKNSGLYVFSFIKAKTFVDGRFTFFGNFSQFKLETESKDAIGQIKIGPYNPVGKKI